MDALEHMEKQADDAIAQAIVLMARMLADAWLPIESAPRDGTKIMITHHTWPAPEIARFEKPQWVTNSGETLLYPSHWMPLPEPPR